MPKKRDIYGSRGRHLQLLIAEQIFKHMYTLVLIISLVFVAFIGDTLQERESPAALLQLHTTPVTEQQVEDARTSELDSLPRENMAMTNKIQNLEAKYKRFQSRALSVNTIQSSTFKLYTGFTSRDQFDAFS